MIITIIGSRSTPPEIEDELNNLYNKYNWSQAILRSGGADGMDTFAENVWNKNLNANKEIYLPWKNFNNNSSNLWSDIPSEAYDIASSFHPVWYKLSFGAKKLMARNVQQVKGKNLDILSDIVLCWTQDGCESHATRTQKTGGTGMAISIASTANIPIINMNSKLWYERLEYLIDEVI